MNTDRDVTRDIRSWLEEGVTVLPDRVLDSVLDQLPATPQRRSSRPAWRMNAMTTPIRLIAAAAAAGVLAVVVGVMPLTTGPAGTNLLTSPSPAAAAPPFGPAANGLIAFTLDGHIHLVEPDGSDLRPITSGPARYGVPSWSRDGTKLAYWLFPDEGPPELIVADADGSDPVTIAQDPGTDGEPDVWSADGSEIMFSTIVPGVGSRIYVAPLDGSGLRQVGDPDLEARSPTLSPDGSTVAFGGGPGAAAGLYVMQWDGSDVRELPGVSRTGNDAFLQQSWSLDETQIATHDNGTPQTIWLVEADGSGATQVSDPARTGIYPSYAPDGSAIIWGDFAGSQMIWAPDDEPTMVAVPGIDSLVWAPDSAELVGVRDGLLVVLGRAGETIAELGPADDSRPSWQRLAP